MNKYSDCQRFLLLYNITGNGHERRLEHIAATSAKDAFVFLVDLHKRLEPDSDIDKWYTFYVVPCDDDGVLRQKWETSPDCHGWKGKINYPNN
ncbi:MAG: hypothetical protein KAS32_23075 [Candidatus Peribacteraceae bacterium]|nr:hypothetical protein [Candidatus Peribacteraceae bacterium]